MVFRVADNGNASAAGNHYLALRDAFFGVVGAFGVYVRANQPDKFADIQRIKNGYGVHVLQGSQHFSALLLGNARTSLALELAHAGIRVDGHNQLPTKVLGRVKIANMAHVQQVKTSVGEDDLLSASAPLEHLLC